MSVTKCRDSLSGKDYCKSDGDIRAEIVQLVDNMTSTGQRSLDDKPLKALKKLCRRSDDYVRHVYYLLMTRLEKQHAEVRLSTFQIARELFVRSHCFRDLLLSNIQQFLELVLAIDPKQPLPPPKWAAVELKQQAVDAINQWQGSFGKTYKKLSIAYNFLKSSRKVDFASILAANESERQRLEQTRHRQEVKNELQLNRTLQEMEGMSADITSCITEAASCMSLLMSDHSMFVTDTDRADSENTSSQCDASATSLCEQKDVDCVVAGSSSDERPVTSLAAAAGAVECSADEQQVTDDEPRDTNLHRQHGVHSRHYALHIDIANDIRIEQNEDNADIVRTLQELTTLLVNRYTPTVKRWLEVMSKVGAAQEHVRKALDVKSSIESMLSRIHKLNIVNTDGSQRAAPCDVDSDDDNDFIEVAAKEGFEPTVPEHQHGEYGFAAESTVRSAAMSWEQKDRQSDIEDPTSLVASVLKRQQLQQQKSEDTQPSTSGTQPCITADCHRQKLLRSAPVVPYGSDLCFWGDNFELPLIVRNNTDSHHWWSPKDLEDAVDVNAVEASKSRVISYVGEFERVKWKCRAPLPNGKLCERMDRLKCPFHGKIVARDEQGVVVTESQNSSAAQQASLPSAGPSALDDEELQTDILLATGVDLRRKDKRKGKRFSRKPKTGLTDISSIRKNTARKRLASKIFKKSSLRRVAAAMNAVDEKRIAERFASSFQSTFHGR